MSPVVSCECRIAAVGLRQAPMWGLVIDGAHKECMCGAPDIIKCGYLDMSAAMVHTRHLGRLTPCTNEILDPDTQELVAPPESAKHLALRFQEQLEWLLQQAEFGPATLPPPSVKAILHKVIVRSTDGASAMTGVRASFGAELKRLGATACLQFTDVGHETE